MITTKEYRDWLIDIKRRIRSSQLKAATAVNTTLLEFYWSLGADIVQKQKTAAWGTGFLRQLSKDLRSDFPQIKGFSYRNIVFARQWYLFYYQDDTKVKQPVSQLATQTGLSDNVAKLCRIPWGHNITIIQKCDTVKQAMFYVGKTIENNWSRSVLTHQIESDLFGRQGKAITHFKHTLPAPQSDLAREIIKDPYNFDFLTLTEDYTERELEKSLIDHIAGFLEGDQPTIGILLCKSKDKVVAEYALSDIHKPMGISEYELTRALPDELKSALPSIDQIEAELEQGGEGVGCGE